MRNCVRITYYTNVWGLRPLDFKFHGFLKLKFCPGHVPVIRGFWPGRDRDMPKTTGTGPGQVSRSDHNEEKSIKDGGLKTIAQLYNINKTQ